jgi:hypothetical protein
MANAFSKEETVLFELLLEKFDPNNITAKEVEIFRPEMTDQERSGYTVWRPIPYVSKTVSGLDITGEFGDLTQLSVPSTIDRIENVPWSLTAQDLNDPLQRQRKAESAAQKLSAVVDNAIATLIGNTGGQVITKVGAAAGYDDIASAETRFLEEDINVGMNRTVIMNGTDWQAMSSNLADRETFTKKTTSAYERSRVGMVAGFDTYRASFNPTLAGDTGATITTGGAPVSHVPLATLPNGVNGGESNVDNRYMDLPVDTTVGVQVGDAFTVPGVFAVSMIHKNTTATLRTFRVISVVDATNLRISPAPVVAGASVAEDEYANVSVAIPASTALTFINTTTAPVNTFWCGDSVEIIEGKLATPASDFAGVSSMRASTDSGIEILFAKGGDVGRLAADYRLTIFFGVTNLQPQMNGILLFNQAA